jgi:hypothetical protein
MFQKDISNRIQGLGKKVEIFSEELRAVLQHHHLLLSIAEDSEIISQFSKTQRARGFRVLRYHMFRTDIVGICKIAFDHDRRVVSALKLIKELLSQDGNELRQVLKDQYSKPWTVPTHQSDGTPLPGDEIQIWQTEELRASNERAEEFVRLLKELAEEREWLKARSRVFKELRNKQIAHLEVKEGGDGDFENVKPDNPSWQTVKETLQHLVRVAEMLLSLVLQKSESFEQAHALYEKDADAFWKP